MSRHSIFPVDPTTHGVEDRDLRGLVERHQVVFEIAPNQVVKNRELIRHGWVVDLYGRPSAADAALSYGEKTHHVHDVLHAVAATLVPEEHRGMVNATLEHFTGAVRIDTRGDFAEEVRLRILLEPPTTARMTLVGDADTAWRDEIIERLHDVGARQRAA